VRPEGHGNYCTSGKKSPALACAGFFFTMCAGILMSLNKPIQEIYSSMIHYTIMVIFVYCAGMIRLKIIPMKELF
jgi:hypothetical protein